MIYSLDYNALSRIGETGSLVKGTKAKKVLIDHYLYPDDFADFEISDTNAVATAVLIYELIDESIAICKVVIRKA